jgi:hypothetical protein
MDSAKMILFVGLKSTTSLTYKITHNIAAVSKAMKLFV